MGHRQPHRLHPQVQVSYHRSCQLLDSMPAEGPSSVVSAAGVTVGAAQRKIRRDQALFPLQDHVREAGGAGGVGGRGGVAHGFARRRRHWPHVPAQVCCKLTSHLHVVIAVRVQPVLLGGGTFRTIGKVADYHQPQSRF
jgi:hypothetical protein